MNLKCIGAAALVAVLAYPAAVYFSVDSYKEVTVTKTDVKVDKYLVYTDVKTFEMTDTWLFWRFDSSDQWGRFQAGETYKISASGVRIPFLSWYENIVSFEKVSK